MLFLFLLLFSCVSQNTAETDENWTIEEANVNKCPDISVSHDIPHVHCRCAIAHTLRCDGILDSNTRKTPILRRLIKEVSALPSNESVNLLDISVKNITKLPGKMFQNLNLDLSGLVISTGALSSIDKKAFYGLEKVIRALGLPDNKLTSVPVDALEQLSMVTKLDLSGNMISSVVSLPRMMELEYLDLSRNNLSLVAGGWTQSTPNLKTLILSGNNLSMETLGHHSPGHMTYLVTLDLAHNTLVGDLSPETVTSLCPPGVKYLDMSFNRLTRIMSDSFSRLSALTTLDLQGNIIDQIQDQAFSGLRSLEKLDLSHNNIVTLGPGSLAGLVSLHHLSLSHNYLQTVSADWLGHVTRVTRLMLMDNDITRVDDGALDNLDNIQEINLAGNLISCDCHVTYLHTWLTHVSNVTSTQTAVCATPPDLTNAPVIQVPAIPTCDTSTDTSDYYYTYEYYHDNTTETSLESFLLSTREVHYLRHVYRPRDQDLLLTFSVDPDATPYKCDLINVFEETIDGPLIKTTIPCVATDTDTANVNVSVNLSQHQLCSNEKYRYCVTFIHHGQIMPGCTLPIVASPGPDHVPRVSISSLHGNVSVTHNMTIHVTSRVPGSQVSSSSVRISVSQPGQSPVSQHTFSCEVDLNMSDPISKEGDLVLSDSCHQDSDHIEYCNIVAVMSQLPEYNYYNVCAELSIGDQEMVDSQCMILHSSTIVRYQTRSVLSLMLTLIFLSLGIACLTVLYLIVKTRASRGRQGHVCDQLAGKITRAVTYWTRLTQYKKNKLVEDFSDDEGI